MSLLRKADLRDGPQHDRLYASRLLKVQTGKRIVLAIRSKKE